MKKVYLSNQKKIRKTKKKEGGLLIAPFYYNPKRPICLSFFSGVGGLDIGARKEQCQTVFQSDIWPVAGRSFLNNINNSNPHLRSEGLFLSGAGADIKKMSFSNIASDVEKHLGIHIQPGSVDVIFGGPPCQDMSKSNTRRNPLKVRNQLIFELLRIIDEAKPKVALIEQVPGILDPDFKILLNAVKLRMNLMTDYIWDHKIMNAAYYGARQARKRIIIMLVRRDLGVQVSFPQPIAPDLRKVAVQALLPHIYHFSPGQFKDGIKSAKDNVFCTMTATGSERAYELDGITRDFTIEERLVLTELEGLILAGIGKGNAKKLLGNMVQVSLASALFAHIKKHILNII